MKKFISEWTEVWMKNVKNGHKCTSCNWHILRRQSVLSFPDSTHFIWFIFFSWYNWQKTYKIKHPSYECYVEEKLLTMAGENGKCSHEFLYESKWRFLQLHSKCTKFLRLEVRKRLISTKARKSASEHAWVQQRQTMTQDSNRYMAHLNCQNGMCNGGLIL